jgi:hypothetical protein
MLVIQHYAVLIKQIFSYTILVRVGRDPEYKQLVLVTKRKVTINPEVIK